jgi:hypothetical protein
MLGITNNIAPKKKHFVVAGMLLLELNNFGPVGLSAEPEGDFVTNGETECYGMNLSRRCGGSSQSEL